LSFFNKFILAVLTAVLYFLCVKIQTNALIVQQVGRNTEYWKKMPCDL